MKKLVTIDKQHTERGPQFKVSYYNCIYLFSLKFPCTIVSCTLSPEKQNRTVAFWRAGPRPRRQGVIRKLIFEHWNLGITRDQETGRICSLYNELSYIIEVLSQIYYYYWSNEIVCYTEDFNLLYGGSLNQGSL